jgi:hypothetical protein
VKYPTSYRRFAPNPLLMVVGNPRMSPVTPHLRRGQPWKFKLAIPGDPWRTYWVLEYDRDSGEAVFSSKHPSETQYNAEHVRVSVEDLTREVEEGTAYPIADPRGVASNPPDWANNREGFWGRSAHRQAHGRDSSRSAPFPEGKRIPVGEFEAWLRESATPQQVRDYERAKAEYRKFHLGAEPRFVTREMAEVSSDGRVTERAFSYSMGRSTHETYDAPKGSGKHGPVYVHKYDDQPEALVFPGGRLIMKKLKGRARITDWMRG